MNRKKTYAAIQINAKAAGMKDEEERRDFFERETGLRSLKAMTDVQLLHLAETIRQTAPKAKPKGAIAPRADLRFIHVLWKLLGDAGKLKKPGRDGLNAFIRARFEKKWGGVPIDVDAIRDHGQISDVIDALKDWCHREGVELNQ